MSNTPTHADTCTPTPSTLQPCTLHLSPVPCTRATTSVIILVLTYHLLSTTSLLILVLTHRKANMSRPMRGAAAKASEHFKEPTCSSDEDGDEDGDDGGSDYEHDSAHRDSSDEGSDQSDCDESCVGTGSEEDVDTLSVEAPSPRKRLKKSPEETRAEQILCEHIGADLHGYPELRRSLGLLLPWLNEYDLEACIRNAVRHLSDKDELDNAEISEITVVMLRVAQKVRIPVAYITQAFSSLAQFKGGTCAKLVRNMPALYAIATLPGIIRFYVESRRKTARDWTLDVLNLAGLEGDALFLCAQLSATTTLGENTRARAERVVVCINALDDKQRFRVMMKKVMHFLTNVKKYCPTARQASRPQGKRSCVNRTFDDAGHPRNMPQLCADNGCITLVAHLVLSSTGAVAEEMAAQYGQESHPENTSYAVFNNLHSYKEDRTNVAPFRTVARVYENSPEGCVETLHGLLHDDTGKFRNGQFIKCLKEQRDESTALNRWRLPTGATIGVVYHSPGKIPVWHSPGKMKPRCRSGLQRCDVVQPDELMTDCEMQTVFFPAFRAYDPGVIHVYVLMPCVSLFECQTLTSTRLAALRCGFLDARVREVKKRESKRLRDDNVTSSRARKLTKVQEAQVTSACDALREEHPNGMLLSKALEMPACTFPLWHPNSGAPRDSPPVAAALAGRNLVMALSAASKRAASL